jgi:hypothetical protein
MEVWGGGLLACALLSSVMFAKLGGGECSDPELACRPIMLSTTRTPRPRRMLRARRTARTVLFNRSDWKLGSRLHQQDDECKGWGQG